MCGRFAFYSPSEAAAALFGVNTAIGVEPRFNIAPTQYVAEKPSFRAAYSRRRCVVLADGFYEWRREGDVKTPYFISLASGEPFVLGGDRSMLESTAENTPPLRAWPVDRRVNNARNQGEELIEADGESVSD